ncbi:hypothetical protein M8997_004205 [Phyllobacterium sp. 21LDTY02-6]|uniref:hypothetical protein n=1 Tax=Phyllobacterium sp. 21LDTY02-6 TaxID=2944903 RepID=UPI002021BF19|nr:hypothetical protein [Phyllobacterium sp. 21LDTY02-6]MCO4316374.1 hypothetical protein [Phyllobacterium sp. 21LDTY02-6]
MNEPELKHDNEVDELIAEHGGDVYAAIKTLLSDREFLIRELQYAALAMGHGYTRGWKPKLLQGMH